MSESAGIIPLLREKKQWKVFLIQHHGYEEYWSCPKGHIEPGESHEEAALRELKEETNLDVKRLIQKDPLIEEFTYMREGKPIDKRIYYFVAEVDGNSEIQTSELVNGQWFYLLQAIEAIKHPEGKQTLMLVMEILESI